MTMRRYFAAGMQLYTLALHFVPAVENADLASVTAAGACVLAAAAFVIVVAASAMAVAYIAPCILWWLRPTLTHVVACVSTCVEVAGTSPKMID